MLQTDRRATAYSEREQKQFSEAELRESRQKRMSYTISDLENVG